MRRRELLRNIQQRVRYCLERNGWSYRRLSLLAGLPNNFVHRIMREGHVPSVYPALRLAQAMGITLDQLISPVEDQAAARLKESIRRQKDPGSIAR